MDKEILNILNCNNCDNLYNCDNNYNENNINNCLEKKLKDKNKFELVQQINKEFENFFKEMIKKYNINIEWTNNNWDFK